MSNFFPTEIRKDASVSCKWIRKDKSGVFCLAAWIFVSCYQEVLQFFFFFLLLLHLSELSVGIVPVCQLRLIPVVGPCKSFATSKRQQQQQPRVFVVVVVCWLNFMACYKQQAYQQQQQVLLLLLLFFLNPSSSSSSHNLELASNNYPKLCKQIKMQQQQQRVQEANCRSSGKDWRKP